MKLIFAIVQNDDAKKLTRALIQERISVTRISSTGGFLHSGNTTLMIGIDAERVQQTLDIIKEKSSTRREYVVNPSTLPGYIDISPMPTQITIGGATVFVLDIEANYKF